MGVRPADCGPAEVRLVGPVRGREAWSWRRQNALLRKTHLWRGGKRALVAQLQFAGEAHGDGEGLWVMDLHVEAEGWLESRGEDLHFLCLG